MASFERSESHRYVPRRKQLAQIEVDLRARIAAGAWKVGDAIPSRRDLAIEYGVDVNVIQRALSPLIADKILVSKVGQGTFVAEPRPIPVWQKEPRFDASARVHNGHPIMIGLVTPLWIGDPGTQLQHSRAAEIVSGFDRYVGACGAVTTIYGMNDDKGNVVDIIAATNLAIAAGCDALLAAMFFNGDPGAAAIGQLASAASIPVMFVGSPPPSPPALSVSYDNVDAGRQAAEHLLDRGITDLLFFSACKTWWVQERLQGVLEVANCYRESGVTVGVLVGDAKILYSPEPPHNTLHGALDDRSVEQAKALLTRGTAGCGIIASNDSLALTFMGIASENGYQAGRDYAIVGFDDRPEDRGWNLTSVRPPWDAMGWEAGRILIEAVNGTASSDGRLSLKTHLVSRSSSLICE